MRFAGGLVLGLILGGAAGAGGMYYYAHRQPAMAPPAADAPAATPPAKGKKPRRGGAASVKEATGEAPPVLTEADLKIVSEGDSLRAGAVTLDMGAGGGEPRDLAQEEIDGTFARRADAIIACITGSRGQAAVNGRVVAGVVVGADGRVEKSRIEAPAYLLRHGLGGCARRELEALRFPATGKETVVSVPFDVRD